MIFDFFKRRRDDKLAASVMADMIPVGPSEIVNGQASFNGPVDRGCEYPPPGWFCTREPGHEGPCAAWPASEMAGRVREFTRSDVVELVAADHEYDEAVNLFANTSLRNLPKHEALALEHRRNVARDRRAAAMAALKGLI